VGDGPIQNGNLEIPNGRPAIINQSRLANPGTILK
jgi:hypothetical protein